MLLMLLVVGQAGAYVYFDDSEDVGRANLDGSAVNHSFAVGVKEAGKYAAPCGEAIDAGHLYFTNSNSNGADSIAQSNLEGGEVKGNFIEGAEYPCGIAVDSHYLYWDNSEGFTGTTIGRVNLETHEVDQHYLEGAHGPFGVAVGGGYIYWGNKQTQAIGRAKLGASKAEEVNPAFITGTNGISGLALAGQYLYWTNAKSWTIGRAVVSGATAEHVEQGFINSGSATKPCGIATYGSYLYWANSTGGPGEPESTIERANIDGTGVEERFITGAGNGPCGVAVDGLGPPPAGNGGGSGSGTTTGGTSGGTTTPPSTCDPILGTCEPQLIVCVGLWTEVCAGPLPSPPSVLTCVSLFQSCNGFGTTGASSGPIDMSGFPSSLTTTTGCQTSTGAFAAARSAQLSGRLAGGPLARAADSTTSNALRGAYCILKASLQTSDPAKANQQLDYLENLQSFRNNDIADARKTILEGLNYVCTPASGAPESTCFNARFVKALLTTNLEADLTAAGEAGKPVNTVFSIPTAACATQTPQQTCLDIMSHLQASVEAILKELASRKHELGVDLPPPSATSSSVHGATLSRAKPRIKRPGIVVIASGYVVLTQHTKAMLKLTIGPRVRKLLRAQHARGVKLLAAKLIVQATLVPGVQSKSTHHVHLTLVKSKQKKHH